MNSQDHYWRGKRCFVTGATGLLGSWMCRRLIHEGAGVVALVRDWVPESLLVREGLIEHLTTVRGALEDYDLLLRALNEHEIDTVFHLGAQTIVGTANRSPLSTFTANVAGTWNLLEAARQTGLVRRVAVASSDKAYGAKAVLPYTEDEALEAKHPYDVSKACTDLIAQSYAHSFGLPVGVTRCGNFYGGGDLNFNRIVPGTIRSLFYDEPPIIRSDGQFIRDYVYIEDAVDAYLTLARALDRDDIRGRAFNFGTGNRVSVVDLVNSITAVMGKNGIEPEILNQASNEIREQYLDSTRAREELGWTPGHTMEQGLDKTVQWYVKFLEEGGARD